jgi:hypothetical protein
MSLGRWIGNIDVIHIRYPTEISGTTAVIAAGYTVLFDLYQSSGCNHEMPTSVDKHKKIEMTNKKNGQMKLVP